MKFTDIFMARHATKGSKGSKGWRSGESTRLPPMWSGFTSWRRRHLWVELLWVLSFAPRGFSPGTPVFPSPLLREVFLRVLRFSPLLKNQHFQIPIRSGTHGHVSTSEFVRTAKCSVVNKLQKKKHTRTKIIIIRKRQSTLEIFIRSFSRNGAKVWNLIPFDWRDASKSVFKRKIRGFLFYTLLDRDDYAEVDTLTY